MRINFERTRNSVEMDTMPVCRFQFCVTMPESIDTQEEAARWILYELGNFLDSFKRSLPRAEIWVNGKQLSRESEKGGGKA